MKKYEQIPGAINYAAEAELPNNQYSCAITIGIHPIDNIAPDFSRTITVVSDNSQTGYEVDTQRIAAIAAFMEQINS